MHQQVVPHIVYIDCMRFDQACNVQCVLLKHYRQDSNVPADKQL